MNLVEIPTRSHKKHPRAKATPVTSVTVEPWVDIAAVARHIGFSYQQTAKMANDGLLPGWPRRSGKRTFWRFKLSEVDAWVKAGNAQQRVG